ncbi:hypothetical protein M3Y98_01095100 [Aphelenchoides besseyi]|nr:hypothetical protein M3Y98_01095100 [Aphelenchoides besseyi]KAI6209372.1 hypothetical protein M3Y96_00214900 [Aphelenchoides besseyi]
MEIDENQLKQWIVDENKCITKRFVYRRCSLDDKAIEGLFQKFYNDYKESKTPIRATFMYNGETDDNADAPTMLSALVPDHKIEEAQKKFVNIRSVSIYALHKEPANLRTLFDADWSREGIESTEPSISSDLQRSEKPKEAEKVKKESPIKRKNAKKVQIKDSTMDDVFSTGVHEEEFPEPIETHQLKETKSEAENVVPVKRDRRNESPTNEAGKVYKKVLENYIDEDGMTATRTVMKEIIVKEEQKEELTSTAKKVVKKPVKETKSKKVPSNQSRLTDFFTKQ